MLGWYLHANYMYCHLTILPQAVPVGCRQRPPDDRWACPADADVDLRWQRLAAAIEGEFCDMFLIEPDRRHLFCGRGEALRIVRVWPKTRVGHSFPHGAVGTLNWRRAQRVLEELAAEPAALQRTQYLASLRKIEAGVLDGPAAKTRVLKDGLRAAPLLHPAELRVLAAAVGRRVDALLKELVAKRSASWQ